MGYSKAIKGQGIGYFFKMRYLLIPTDNSGNNIPIEVPDDIIVKEADHISSKLNLETTSSTLIKDKVSKVAKSRKRVSTGTKIKNKKKIQTSRAYGETYNSNIKRAKSK